MPVHGSRRRGLAGLRWAILAAGVLLPFAPALALWGDRLELVGSETVAADSNVFRISSGRDPATFIGSPTKSDSYRITSLGLNLDIPVSRQRFKAGYAVNEARYHRFKDLNFDGYNGQALWLWELGNQASGRLGYSESYALASLSDFQTRIPNPLKVKQSYFDAAYLLTPSWRLGAGASQLRQSNGDSARRADDVEVLAANASIAYLSRAGNSLGGSVAVEDGRFPNPQIVGGAAFDNAYTQRSASLLLDWTLTGKSHLYVRAGLVKRGYVQLPQRDFDGRVLRVEYEWKATGKLAVLGIVQRDISPVEDIRTSFVRVTGAALRPTLSITEKTSVSANLEYSVRDYLGDPQLALGLAPERTDRVRSATLNLSYRPVPRAILMLGLQRESRSSTLDFGDYRTSVIRFSARIAF